MKIEFNRYVIATKEHPIEFDDGSGNLISDIDHAMMWFEEKYARESLKMFDEPSEYKIIRVRVTYEF